MPVPLEPVFPFRWNLAKRSELGRLIEDLTAEDGDWLVEHLCPVVARVIAFAGDSDLYFVGRSPESLFDYLSGLLFDSTWAGRLHLLHFSTLYWRDTGGSIKELRRYLGHLHMDPLTLARRPRPVAFIDVVDSGSTFGSLIRILHRWSDQTGGDWAAIRHKIRLVGLTWCQKSSPKTWRWQQHARWIALLQSGAVKNLSVEGDLMSYLGGGQSKVTQSYVPARWGDPSIARPQYDAATLQALCEAVALFDAGREPIQRARFAQALARQPAMQHAWFRALISELHH